MSKSFLQRVPDNLLAQVEAWALSHGGVTRTVAINILIVQGLEADERESLRAKVEELQREVIKLNSVHMPLIKALQKAAETLTPKLDPVMVSLKENIQPECSDCKNIKDSTGAGCKGCGVYENAEEGKFAPAFKKERRAVL